MKRILPSIIYSLQAGLLASAMVALVQAQDMNETTPTTNTTPATPPEATTPSAPTPSTAAPSTAGGDALEACMKAMSKAYKTLVKDLKQPVDTDKDQYLQLVDTLKTSSVKAHDLVPNKADGLPDDQKAAMVTAYQKDMDQFGQTVDTLSQAIKDSKWDDAQKALATLKQEMIDGHKAYRKKEE